MSDPLPWLALKSVPGVGNLMFRRLLERFGSPEAVLAADKSALGEVSGVSARLAGAIHGHRTNGAAKRELAAARAKGYRIITQADSEYPALLVQIPDPPPLLYVYGTLFTEGLIIAVVGSRNATNYGIGATRQLCMDLAGQGVTIVSGMARGVDTAAHTAAMDAGGRTLAVLGTGLDRIYPRENEHLYQRIAENGAVISEFPLGSGPDAHRFPARNRIISGMSHGTVVVEAAARSGSLITARLAADQGRDVFAVPGNIHSFKSVGTHTLIKEGAKLAAHAWDVLDEFEATHPRHKVAATPETAPRQDLTEAEIVIMDILEADPIHIDDLVRKAEIPPGELSGTLLQLELKGLAVQSPGKRFALAPGVDWRT